MDIKQILTIALSRKSSDIHLVYGHYPTLRVEGELVELPSLSLLKDKDIENMLFSVLTDNQKEILVTNKELDFSLSLKSAQGEEVRFRGNAYYQLNELSASFRIIPFKIKTPEELFLPSILKEFAKLRQGFVLLTGASGQGKSTTIASLLNEINRDRAVHIITIEDPIEFVFPKRKALISQREMYQDTHSWDKSLKSVLREDPDVVFIGEMRDLDTIQSAMLIAETGHLVFSTLHTNSASQTIDRIVDVFPPNSQDQVKMQLSMVLSGVITQKLVPTTEGSRMPVCEIMVGTAPIKNTIREGKIHMIDNIIQTSSDAGMILFEDHLRQLVINKKISHETALEYALRPERYLQLMKI